MSRVKIHKRLDIYFYTRPSWLTGRCWVKKKVYMIFMMGSVLYLVPFHSTVIKQKLIRQNPSNNEMGPGYFWLHWEEGRRLFITGLIYPALICV